MEALKAFSFINLRLYKLNKTKGATQMFPKTEVERRVIEVNLGLNKITGLGG